MTVITVTLPSDGDDAIVEPYNDAINAILATVNGNLDDSNISSVSGTKITPGTIPPTAFNATTNQGWVAFANQFTYGSNNGNKEFTMTYTGDLTSIIETNMKLKVSRGTTPPTQAMSFTAASSQYATKASPSGISFTGPFTVEAWIYVNSYTGQVQTILNRKTAGGSNGGWRFYLDANGAITLEYGTSSSFTNFVGPIIPRQEWVHVAGVATSVSGKTGQIYINGAAAITTSSLNAATALAQENVDLRIGAASATPTNTYFDGFMSEVRLWAADNSSFIASNMAISLTGSETNLIGLWQGNGNFNDTNANANTLTTSGGASATTVMNPYNAIEYAFVTKVVYSNPTTTVTVYSGNDFNIPNGTLTGAAFSIAKKPFGFPVNPSKWTVMLNSNSTASLSNGTWQNGGNISITIPTGTWVIKAKVNFDSTRTGSTAIAGNAALSENATAITVGYEEASFSMTTGGASGSQRLAADYKIDDFVKNYASATTIYAIEFPTDTSSALALGAQPSQFHYLKARFAGL